MHPVLVKVLPPSVRRGYYELVDYQLPRIFSRYWVYRAIYWAKYWLSPAFRRRERESIGVIQRLTEALAAGYNAEYLAGPQSLKIESLEPVMRVVTFDDRHLKFRR